MGLIDRSPQAQRYSLLSPDVMQMIQSGGPRMAPAPAAPAAPARRGQPGFLTYLLGGSEGLDAERARRQAELDAPQVMARREANRAAAAQMGPAALLAFDNNPEAFAESLGMQYRPVTTAAGSRTTYGPSVGSFAVEQPTFGETGDETVRRDSMGVRPVYTRTAPSITEQVNQGELGVKRQLADQQQQQFGQRLELDRSRFASDEEYRQAQLDLENRKFESGQSAPRPGDNEDRAAIVGFEAANARFATQLRNIAGDPEAGAPPAFDLSPLNAARYKAALATGIGMTPEAAAYGDYVSEIEAAVSESLRLNVGPQTDQDAIREARALLSNIDNREYVLRRLPTVMANNDRLRAGRERLLRERRPNGGAAPAGGGQPAPAAPRRLSPQEAANLPPGTRFVGTDGVERVRQ